MMGGSRRERHGEVSTSPNTRVFTVRGLISPHSRVGWVKTPREEKMYEWLRDDPLPRLFTRSRCKLSLYSTLLSLTTTKVALFDSSVESSKLFLLYHSRCGYLELRPFMRLPCLCSVLIYLYLVSMVFSRHGVWTERKRWLGLLIIIIVI